MVAIVGENEVEETVGGFGKKGAKEFWKKAANCLWHG